MGLSARAQPGSAYHSRDRERRWLHGCALVLAAISFLAIITGTVVSSNEERPLYGFGQTHIWIGVAAGALTLAVAILARTAHEPPWLRHLSWSVLAAAAIQAMLGFGMLFEPSTAVRIAHTVIARLFFWGNRGDRRLHFACLEKSSATGR